MTDLIRRLEALTGPSREIDAEIAVASGQFAELFKPDDGSPSFYVSGIFGGPWVEAPPYTKYIDIALTLLTWQASWNIGSYLDQYVASVGNFTEKGATPAIALVIAIFKAKEQYEARKI